MDELISQQQNPLTFTSSGSIASSGNDVFSQVLGKERNGQIHGLGFGLTPSKFGLSSITIGSSIKVELEEESLRDKETICKLKEELLFQEQKLMSQEEKLASQEKSLYSLLLNFKMLFALWIDETWFIKLFEQM